MARNRPSATSAKSASGGDPGRPAQPREQPRHRVGQDHPAEQRGDEFGQRQAEFLQDVVEFVGNGNRDRDDQQRGEDAIHVELGLPLLVVADADREFLGVLAGQAMARDQPVPERTAQQAARDQPERRRGCAQRRRGRDAERLADDRSPCEHGAMPARQCGGAGQQSRRGLVSHQRRQADRDAVLHDQVCDCHQREHDQHHATHGQQSQVGGQADRREEDDQQRVAGGEIELDLGAGRQDQQRERGGGDEATGHRFGNAVFAQPVDTTVHPAPEKQDEDGENQRVVIVESHGGAAAFFGVPGSVKLTEAN